MFASKASIKEEHMIGLLSFLLSNISLSLRGLPETNALPFLSYKEKSFANTASELNFYDNGNNLKRYFQPFLQTFKNPEENLTETALKG